MQYPSFKLGRVNLGDNINTLTESKFEFQEESPPVIIGLFGWWQCPLKEVMVLEETTLQLYESTHYRFCLYNIPVSLTEWQLLEEIKEYHYEQKRKYL